VTICDFGLSRPINKLTADGKTIVGRTGTLLGPIKWMAPELLKEEIDEEGMRYQSFGEQTDVYMFGVFLWEVFARSEPYPGLTDLKAAHFIASENGSLDLTKCRCPSQYREVVAKCLSRDPKQRPTTDSIAATLRELCDEIKAKQQENPSVVFSTPDGKQLGGRLQTSENVSENESESNVIVHLPTHLERNRSLTSPHKPPSPPTSAPSSPTLRTDTHEQSTYLTNNNYLAIG